MSKILVLFFLVTLLNGGEIRVAVSANVSYAMDDLIEAFRAVYPHSKVSVQIGSSGKLAAQIKNAAPYDLFLSADMKYPQKLYEEGMAITRPLVYAQGALALLSSKARDFSKGIFSLEAKEIKKIAIANPKTAPYGRAAREALVKAKLYEKLKDRFVYAESVSQTVAYATMAADIGIVAKSSLFSGKMKKFQRGKNWLSLDPSLYTPINQGITILKHGRKNVEAAAFFAFIFSKEAGEIFRRYGYMTP